MGKQRIGGYVFVTWVGDHHPRHVHVFRNQRLVLKWNLDDDVAMFGKITGRLCRLIRALRKSGKL